MAIPPDAPARPPGDEAHDLGAAHVWVRARESADGLPEDDWGWRQIAGLPGTDRERPNWRRKARVPS